MERQPSGKWSMTMGVGQRLMRPIRARRRVLESLAKAKALLIIQAETRLNIMR